MYFPPTEILKIANFPTLGPKGPQKPPNLHIIPNVGSINPIKYVLSPNRNPQNCKFPNPGPEGPTETPQFTYNPKCWQHKSNKICTFPQQKSSKLHIFSNPGPEGPTETLKMYAEGLPPHFHFHNDRSLSSNTTIFLQNHDEAYHFLPRG